MAFLWHNLPEVKNYLLSFKDQGNTRVRAKYFIVALVVLIELCILCLQSLSLAKF
jgi:hypothetical protein